MAFFAPPSSSLRGRSGPSLAPRLLSLLLLLLLHRASSMSLPPTCSRAQAQPPTWRPYLWLGEGAGPAMPTTQ